MAYKVSNFNIEVEVLDNKNILMYNTLTSSFGIMDPSTKQIYDEIEQLGEVDIEKIKDNNNFKTLVEYGYIVPEEFNEYEYIKFQSQYSKYNSNALTLTIAPTINCNMDCPYCYEKKEDISMSEEVKIVLYDFVKDYLETKKCSEFYVSWYGGEPLMDLDTIIDLSNKFIKLCQDKNINYNSSIVTNGVLLDRDTALIISNQCNVKMAQITIDGMPDYHNSRRLLKDGRDSFDIIIKNIESIKDIINISVRVNVDKENMPNIDDLSDFLLYEMGWTDNPSFYLAPVEKYNNSYCNECINEKEFSDLSINLLKKQYDANPNMNYNYKLYPQRRVNFCSAVRTGNYVVDPDGDLYTCWNLVGQKEKKIGNIIQKNSMNTEYIKWLLHEPIGRCLSCKLLPACSGGCPYQAIINGKSKCDMTLKNYKDTLKLAYNKFIEKKNNNMLSKMNESRDFNA